MTDPTPPASAPQPQTDEYATLAADLLRDIYYEAPPLAWAGAIERLREDFRRVAREAQDRGAAEIIGDLVDFLGIATKTASDNIRPTREDQARLRAIDDAIHVVNDRLAWRIAARASPAC